MQREISPIRDGDIYSNRYLNAGALIAESLEMLAAVSIGSNAEGVRKRMSSGTLLEQHSQITRENIWEALNHRFFVRQFEWAVPELVAAYAVGEESPELNAILYLQYVFRDHLTYDLVTQVIWSRWQDGSHEVRIPDGLALLDRAEAEHPVVCRWSEGSRVQLVDGIFTALDAFGLLAADGPKWLITPDFPLSAAEYVLRVLHAEGLRGEELAGNLGWRVLLCDRDAVDAAMKRLESSGAIELENDDDGLQIAVPKDWW